MKKALVGLLIAILVTGLVGSVAVAQNQQGEQRFFGISTKIVHNVWEGLFQNTFKWFCEDNDWRYTAMNARGEPTLQTTQIRRLVDMGVDGLIVSAQDADVTASAVEYAVDHDVPVFTTDADVNSEEVAMYVGYSGVRASRKLGEEIVEHLREEVEPEGEVEGRVLEIRGPMGGASAEDRHKGFIEVMNEYEGIEVETVEGDFQQEPAKEKALPKVRARDFDALYAGNGPMALGGVSAMESSGKDPSETFTVTIDATPEVIEAIKEGKVAAAFDQPASFYNPIALYYMDKYLEEGEEALPEQGETVTAEDLNIEPAEHSDITWWEKATWAPAKITTREGHLWFQTSGILVDKSNADLPSLWANADLPGW
ncbi:MAG: sugar ABC transporter substrate-binding protein [Candidatus Acetothermia bacterium]